MLKAKQKGEIYEIMLNQKLSFPIIRRPENIVVCSENQLWNANENIFKTKRFRHLKLFHERQPEQKIFDKRKTNLWSCSSISGYWNKMKISCFGVYKTTLLWNISENKVLIYLFILTRFLLYQMENVVKFISCVC